MLLLGKVVMCFVDLDVVSQIGFVWEIGVCTFQQKHQH